MVTMYQASQNRQGIAELMDCGQSGVCIRTIITADAYPDRLSAHQVRIQTTTSPILHFTSAVGTRQTKCNVQCVFVPNPSDIQQGGRQGLRTGAVRRPSTIMGATQRARNGGCAYFGRLRAQGRPLEVPGGE